MPRDPIRIRRNGPYAPLSATYYDDDAIATLDEVEDDRTELLFVRGLAYCARDPKLDGFISAVVLRTGRVLRRRPRKSQDVIYHAELLVKAGLWEAEQDGYRVSQWSKWNRTAEEIEHAQKTDRDRKGTRGGTEDAA